MIAKHIHLSLEQASAVLIALVFVGKVYAVLTYGADLALFPAIYNQTFCPPHCWTFTTSIPYSIVWTWINPLWLGRFWYGVYVVTFDGLTCLAYWRVKRVPRMYLALLQALSIEFYLGQGSEYQNITIIALFPLMFFACNSLNGERSKWRVSYRRLVPLALAPILIKLPLGWSLPWVINEHVQCVWICSGFSHFPLISSAGNLVINYGILVFTWYWTISQVRTKRLNNRTNS